MPELVRVGVSGVLVDDVVGAVPATGMVRGLDRAACRADAIAVLARTGWSTTTSGSSSGWSPAPGVAEPPFRPGRVRAAAGATTPTSPGTKGSASAPPATRHFLGGRHARPDTRVEPNRWPGSRPPGHPARRCPRLIRASDAPTTSRTRAGAPAPEPHGSASWSGLPSWCSDIAFMLQNTVPVEVAFFGLDGHGPARAGVAHRRRGIRHRDVDRRQPSDRAAASRDSAEGRPRGASRLPRPPLISRRPPRFPCGHTDRSHRHSSRRDAVRPMPSNEIGHDMSTTLTRNSEATEPAPAVSLRDPRALRLLSVLASGLPSDLGTATGPDRYTVPVVFSRQVSAKERARIEDPATARSVEEAAGAGPGLRRGLRPPTPGDEHEPPGTQGRARRGARHDARPARQELLTEQDRQVAACRGPAVRRAREVRGRVPGRRRGPVRARGCRAVV